MAKLDIGTVVLYRYPVAESYTVCCVVYCRTTSSSCLLSPTVYSWGSPMLEYSMLTLPGS